jgi:hypothetical protein
MVSGMDRRQLLDGVASMARLGDLADDVVLACAAVRNSTLSKEDSGALREGLSLVEALTEFERPVASTPASLDAMSRALAVNEAVDRVTFTFDGSADVYFAGLSGDLKAILDGSHDDERLERVERFFSNLAIGTLQTTDLMMRPRVRDLAWTSTAPSF